MPASRRPGSKVRPPYNSASWQRKIRAWRKARNRIAKESRRRNRR